MTILNSHWSIQRIIRFALGLFMIHGAIVDHSILMGIVGAVLMYQVYSNAGCATDNCDINAPK